MNNIVSINNNINKKMDHFFLFLISKSFFIKDIKIYKINVMNKKEEDGNSCFTTSVTKIAPKNKKEDDQKNNNSLFFTLPFSLLIKQNNK